MTANPDAAHEAFSDDDVAGLPSPETTPSHLPPSFKVAAVASVAGFRDSCGNVPIDTCIPVRTSAPLPEELLRRSAFVLAHVDGVHSLQEIAARTELSFPDTIEAYLDLLLLGLVSVRALNTQEPA